MDPLLYLYFSLVLAPAFIAPSKNRRWWVWLAIGLLFSPLVSFAVVFMAKVAKCPHCAEKIKDGAKVCPHCRSTIGPATANA